jgi:hypothetical protein
MGNGEKQFVMHEPSIRRPTASICQGIGTNWESFELAILLMQADADHGCDQRPSGGSK